MDELDVTILTLLQENARMPLSDISNRLNLSLPAVSKRVSKLERNGIIKQYTAILDPEKFNKRLSCFCFVILKNKTQGNDQVFRNFILSEPDIVECHCVTGEYEFVLKIVTESAKHLEDLLGRLRRETPVARTSSLIVLSAVKAQASVMPCISSGNP